jgi:hypothetical protein
MEGHTGGRGLAAPAKNLLFFAVLLALGFIFFATVRNNTFWHPGDYQYLLHSLQMAESWRAVFAQDPHDTFQPLINLIFYGEFAAFGLNPTYYYAFNVVVHSLNAFLVYVLVMTLLRARNIAVLSGLLFVFAVGNYGKAVMVVSGISDLVITALTLLTMIYYVRNELAERGRMWSGNFILCLLFFILVLLSKATSFSILGCMLAFNLFFRDQTGRRLFDNNFLIIAAVALVVLIVKLAVLRSLPGASDFTLFSWSLPRNFASYLVRMVFPIHYSNLVTDAGGVVQAIYRFASQIRFLIFLCIVSYSIFGFIFGNKVIRFFIAWTYITVAPFCLFRFPSDWLNIRYLYLVSVGFSMLLASGTVLAARLLYERAWRRRLPYLIPAFFVLLSAFVVHRLDDNYEAHANNPRLDSARAELAREYEAFRERHGHPPTQNDER